MSKHPRAVIGFSYSYNGKDFRQGYKSIEKFLSDPTVNNDICKINFDTIIHKVRVKHTDIDVTTVRELYEFVKENPNIEENFTKHKANNEKTKSLDVVLYEKNLKNYQRKKKYSIRYIESALNCKLFDDRKSYISIDGDKIKANSQRYQTFFTKGTKCCVCGLEGKYFWKEKFSYQNSYHLNLYGINENGVEVMLTKDHIIPVSKGGENSLNNYQTMCEVCNQLKGNKLEE